MASLIYIPTTTRQWKLRRQKIEDSLKCLDKEYQEHPEKGDILQYYTQLMDNFETTPEEGVQRTRQIEVLARE